MESGELLAVYEWSIQTSRNHLSRRRKQVLSIQQEFESTTSQALCHPRLLQYLDMTVSPFEADCRITVEVRGEEGKGCGQKKGGYVEVRGRDESDRYVVER